MATTAPGSGKTIDVKRAVQLARQALLDLFADDIQDVPRLEEVQLSDDESTWLITMSFGRRPVAKNRSAKGALSEMLSQLIRDYKRVAVSATDGSVKSVNIRTLPT